MNARPAIASAFAFVSTIVSVVALPIRTTAGSNALLTAGGSSATMAAGADISEVLSAASIAVAVTVQPEPGGTNATVAVKTPVHPASVETAAEPRYWCPWSPDPGGFA